ncbi:MAG: response regulator [Bacteroidota bacterium]|jgi:CRP-like cAMP-binding protein/CheY-like chemotaxis protein
MKKILLIEDNKDMRENTAEILELAHYEVITAENGKDGVEKAMKTNPDLIVCDIMMPVLDGYGVLHLLSKNDQTASIPFIFLSAKAERSELRRGMEMGADDYVTKPFDDIELLNAIESRLQKSERVRRDFSRDITGLNEFVSEAKGFDALRELSAHRDVRSCRKKESIYVQDSFPKGIYMVVSGKVKTGMVNEQGKELITGLYKEGDFFGYLALLEDKPYSDSATALEDAEVCLIPKEDFFALLYKNTEVARRFVRLLADNLTEKEEQLLKLAYNSVRKRVAEALVTLCNRYRREGEETFTMTISREDLANLAGTATETTIRTLSDFKEEGLVEVKGGTITVVSYDKLHKMKN